MDDKNAYEQKIDAQLKEWQARIDEARAKGEQQTADAKIEYQKQIGEMESRMEAVRAKLDELKKASSDSWEDLKTNIDRTTRDMGDKLDQFKAKLGMN